MKFLFLLIFCLMSFYSFTQSQKELVKKLGIKKMTTVTTEEGYDDKTTVVYFDDKGNDTSTHTYGKRYQYAVIEYDNKNRVTKKQTFWDNEEPAMSFTYTYAKDGSFRVDDEDAEFKMKSTSWYNVKGNIIKVKIPDGTVRNYSYDAKANLVKFQSIAPGKKPKTETAKNKLDNKGRLVEVVWSDGARSTYKYDERGLFSETTTQTKGNEDLAGYKDKTTYTYE